MTIEELQTAKIACPETGIEVRKSVCDICDPLTQCGLDLYVKDGKVIKVEGSEENPYSKGCLCSKGAATRQYIYSKDRIKVPLKRTGPKGSFEFKAISWDEALDEVAARFNALKQAGHPEEGVFFAGYSKWFRAYFKRLCHSYGSPNYATESSTCQQAMAIAQRLVYGIPAGPDMPRAKCLLIWSSDPFYTNPGVAKALLKNIARGMKLIVVDPRVTPTTQRANIHLMLKPGTDGALALSMAHVIIEENLYDKAFIEKWSYGFDEYREYVKEWTPEEGEKATGVDAALIVQAARMFARNAPAAIMPSASPVVHHTNGVQNYRAVFMLLGLTGNYDIHGGNLVNPPSFGYQCGNFKSREGEFEQPISMSKLPTRLGADKFPVWTDLGDAQTQAMCFPEVVKTEKPYPIKAILALGMNFRMWPDPEGWAESLKKIDFFVNADIFMTDTCKYADIVLPVCTSVERSEFRCYNMGYAILTQPAIEPLYESRSDADLIFDLAKRIAPDDSLMAKGYEACIDYILEPSGMTCAELKKHPGGMFVPNPIAPAERKYEKAGFKTPSGKFEFVSKVLERYKDRPGFDPLPMYRPPKYSAEATPELAKEYPLILSTGSRLPMFVHTRTYRLSWASSLRPNHPSVDMNPQDAAKLGLNQNDNARLSTKHGAINVKVNLTLMVQKGMVSMYHGNSKADANTLFESDYLDPISGFPGFKSALCKVEKI
jgi:anaerobic selenocysteine-containing dehydrogenase